MARSVRWRGNDVLGIIFSVENQFPSYVITYKDAIEIQADNAPTALPRTGFVVITRYHIAGSRSRIETRKVNACLGSAVKALKLVNVMRGPAFTLAILRRISQVH